MLWKVLAYASCWLLAAAMVLAVVHGGSKLNPHDSDDWPQGGAA